MKNHNTFLSNILLLVVATLLVAFSSVFFTSFPVHKHNINSVCDMRDFSFDTHSRYSICNDFKKVFCDEELEMTIYEATFLIPESISSFAIRVPAVPSEFSIYINGELFYTNTESFSSSRLPLPSVKEYILNSNSSRVIKMTVHTREVNTLFPSPNYNPIAYRDFLIGSISGLYFFQNLFVLFDIILLSICVISVAFHFIAFLYRNTSKIHILFSLLSISGVICIALSGQECITLIYPSIPMAISTRMMIFGLFTRLLSILEIEKLSFTSLHRRRTYTILNITNYVVFFVSLLLPIPYIFYSFTIYYVLILISVIVAINEGYKSYAYDNSPLTRTILVGLYILFIGAFSDITHHIGINKAYETFFVAQLIFVILQSFVTSIDYSNLLAKNKRLTESLKQKVFDIQNNESTFIASHINPTYIYDTLDIINSSIDKDQDKVDVLIQSLSKYLRYTFDYSSTNSIYSYKEELNLCYAYRDIIIAKYPFIKINFNLSDTLPSARIPMFSIMSLIENSVHLTVKKVLHPEINIEAVYDHDSITFSVSDNGIGMSQDEIRTSLDHPHENLTYGLYQTNQLLIDKCNSKLQINSVINKHTTALFVITIDTEEDS